MNVKSHAYTVKLIFSQSSPSFVVFLSFQDIAVSLRKPGIAHLTDNRGKKVFCFLAHFN